MLHSTPGIVLHTIKYGDSGIVARVLTRNLGLQSYLVQGVRKSRSRIRASIFQPLNLVDMEVYHKETSRLHRIKEIQIKDPLANLGNDIRKTSLALFISELLLHAFRHQEINTEGFDFIYKAIIRLDEQDSNLATFHIIFMLQLSKYLGFSPSLNFSETNCFFNLREGTYQKQFDNGIECLNETESGFFFTYSKTDLMDERTPIITATVKSNLLHKCIHYYRLHMEGFGELKSVGVLESIFI
jgi:DNA repair protein RecO (recombination protein O)